MSKDFSYLRTWLQNGIRPVVLECVPSRSGLSMTVYDRGERLFTVQGCGFDRIGTALGEFLEECFLPELAPLARLKLQTKACVDTWEHVPGFYGFDYNSQKGAISLDGGCGIESMREIAEAIGLSVQVHETRSSTLLIIQKVTK